MFHKKFLLCVCCPSLQGIYNFIRLSLRGYCRSNPRHWEAVVEATLVIVRLLPKQPSSLKLHYILHLLDCFVASLRAMTKSILCLLFAVVRCLCFHSSSLRDIYIFIHRHCETTAEAIQTFKLLSIYLLWIALLFRFAQ